MRPNWIETGRRPVVPVYRAPRLFIGPLGTVDRAAGVIHIFRPRLGADVDVRADARADDLVDRHEVLDREVADVAGVLEAEASVRQADDVEDDGHLALLLHREPRPLGVDLDDAPDRDRE